MGHVAYVRHLRPNRTRKKSSFFTSVSLSVSRIIMQKNVLGGGRNKTKNSANDAPRVLGANNNVNKERNV